MSVLESAAGNPSRESTADESSAVGSYMVVGAAAVDLGRFDQHDDTFNAGRDSISLHAHSSSRGTGRYLSLTTYALSVETSRQRPFVLDLIPVPGARHAAETGRSRHSNISRRHS